MDNVGIVYIHAFILQSMRIKLKRSVLPSTAARGSKDLPYSPCCSYICRLLQCGNPRQAHEYTP